MGNRFTIGEALASVTASQKMNGKIAALSGPASIGSAMADIKAMNRSIAAFSGSDRKSVV